MNDSPEKDEAVLSRAGKPILEVKNPREPAAGGFTVSGKLLVAPAEINIPQPAQEWSLRWNARTWTFQANILDANTQQGRISLSILGEPKEEQ